MTVAQHQPAGGASSRRRILVGLIVTMIIGFMPDTAEAAEPAPLPQGLEVHFGEDVSVATRWYVESAIAAAWRHFAPLISDPESLEAAIVVVTGPEEAAEAWAERRGTSLSRARRLFSARSGHYAGLATPGLTVIINENRFDAGATIHELTHLVQYHVAGGSGRGPRWLSEGAAQYFDLLIESEWGVDAGARHPRLENQEIAAEWAATYDNCRRERLPAGSETCRWAMESLARLESGGPFDIGGGAVSAYSRAAVAFQTLMARSGESSYFCFLERAGGDWRTAFAACFGTTVAGFYREFDVLRARGFVGYAPSRFFRPL